ncbi:CDP-archaeol synthase [Candidatus Woesearchaeota archaeon]|nr:CDP-archaeol synthase [Candidatus Woesearchaeota archaeon]
MGLNESMFAVLQLGYFFLPAYVANMMPVIGKDWLKDLARPVNAHWFGGHKTWRGIVLGVIGAIVIAFVQSRLAPYVGTFSIAPYRDWWLLGSMLGLGALLGDLLKSFIKRRLAIKPGASWVPFDQIDFVIGGLALSSLVFFPGWAAATVLLVMSFFLHIIVNRIGFALGMRSTSW